MSLCSPLPAGQRTRTAGKKTVQVGSHKSQIGNVSGCSYPCHLPSHTPASQNSISLWIAIWYVLRSASSLADITFDWPLFRAGTCLVLSGFTVLTFLIEMDRFQYPERPIFILAFCQLMVAIGFILRVAYGHDQVPFHL